MERLELENRLRQTLATRAEGVTPSPDLWDRVADDTVRRSAWRSPARWAGLAAAAAAVAVAVVVVPGMLDRPDAPVIEPVTSQTDAAPVGVGDGVRVVVGRDGENAIGGFGSLVEVDPRTGADQRVIDEGQPERDFPTYLSTAFRPDGSGDLAELVWIEGVFDLRVRDAGGERWFGAIADPTSDATDDPRLAWSQDGAYLVWTATPDDADVTELRLLDMGLVTAESEGEPDAALAASQVLLPGWAAGAHVTDVVGVRGGELFVTAQVGGEPVGLLLVPTAGCTDASCEYELGEQRPLSAATGTDPKTILAVDSDANPGAFVGPTYALVAFNTGRLGLTVGGDGDQLTALELPEELAADGAAAQHLWLDAAGEHVLVGRDGRAWLLRVELDADTPHVVDVVAIEGDRNATGAVTVVGVPTDDRPVAAGQLELEIETLTTSPAGHPITADVAQLRGLDDDGVTAWVNDELLALTQDVVAAWDAIGDVPREPDRPWELTFTVEPQVVTPQLLSLAYRGHEYTGGANGTAYWRTVVSDLATGDPITIDDVLVDGGRDALTAIVARALARAVEADRTEDDFARALAAEPAVLDQFVVTSNGLRFLLDEFQLGLPGAAGAPDAEVTTAEVLDLLRPGLVRDFLTTAPDLGIEVPTDAAPDQGRTAQVVVSWDETADQLLVTGGDVEDAVVPRPAGIDDDMMFGGVTIRPAAPGDDVMLVSQWCIGDGCSRAWTVLHEGEVIRNEVAPGELQSYNSGGIMETTIDTPVFDASGDVLAWTELNSDESVYIVIVQDWRADAPGTRRAVTADTHVGGNPLEVLAVTQLEDGIEVHTSAFSSDPGESATLPHALRFSLAADVGDFTFFDAGTAVVDLPGVPRGGGNANGAVAGAVVLVDAEGGPLLVRLTDPTEVLELGSDIDRSRPLVGVVADGVVVRLTDGSFRQTTLDGDVRSIDLPEGVVAVTGL